MGDDMRFKIGNKVRVVNPYSGGNFEDGDIVEIVQIGFEDEDCYGAISPYDNIMWFLQEDEVAPVTIADKIRTMSDEEMAEFMATKLPDYICDWTDLMLKWLQQPAEVLESDI